MLPFIPPFPNQNQVQGGNDPSPNQFPRSSNAALPNQFGFNNPQILMPAMGGFNNQNALLGTLLAQQHLMQGLQNNFMGALLQQGLMPQLHGQQLNFFGALQSPNFMSLQQGGLLGRPPMGPNMNQMMGFSPNGLLCSQNPIFPSNSRLPLINSGNSNPGFLGNGSTQVGQSLSSSTGIETQIASQKLQEPILPSPLQDNKSNERQWPQLRHGQAGGKYFSSNSSENVASNNFKPKFNNQGKRKTSHMRFQKSQSYNSRNTWQKERPFPRNNQRGHHKRKEKNPNFSEGSDNTSTMRKRPLSVTYSESEILQWREARKRNFPTRTNIEKKLRPSKEDIDSCAEVRRQQLKEVLAKQAELGVQVAEIPSIYLTEPEEQTSKNVNASEALNTNIDSKKRGRFRRNKRNAKRLKFRNEAEAAPAHEPVVKKREPTLLWKLLNGDIRRDKCQLLQAFRFMALNTFFKGLPDKPLLFPIITTKDGVPESEVFVKKKKPFQDRVDSDANFLAKNGNDEEAETKKYSTVVGVVKSECDEDNDFDDASNVVCETIGEDFILYGGDKSEEGEITN